jgi:ribosome maturation factor RimP
MVKDEIQKIINKTAEETGYMVYESSIYLKGENSKIIVKIDSLKPISHGDCEQFSTRLSFNLDGSRILPNYFLEISSPGLDRKLRNIDELIRFVGSPVKIVHADGDINRVLQGRLVAVSETGIEVETEKNKVLIRHDNIIHANLYY